MKYNWQHPNWANFTYDTSVIESIIVEFATEIGEIKGMLNSLSDSTQQDTILQFMISEAIKTSEIYNRQNKTSNFAKQNIQKK